MNSIIPYRRYWWKIASLRFMSGLQSTSSLGPHRSISPRGSSLARASFWRRLAQQPVIFGGEGKGDVLVSPKNWGPENVLKAPRWCIIYWDLWIGRVVCVHFTLSKWLQNGSISPEPNENVCKTRGRMKPKPGNKSIISHQTTGPWWNLHWEIHPKSRFTRWNVSDFLALPMSQNQGGRSKVKVALLHQIEKIIPKDSLSKSKWRSSHILYQSTNFTAVPCIFWTKLDDRVQPMSRQCVTFGRKPMLLHRSHHWPSEASYPEVKLFSSP